jgi:hypothetical protein
VLYSKTLSLRLKNIPIFIIVTHFEWILKLATQEGTLVFDPDMKSANVAKASEKMGIDFIGFAKN